MNKAKVEIYTWRTCRYSQRAKELLSKKGVEFTEYDIEDDEAAREKMAERAHGRRSVPQVFIDGKHIGGCDDLHDLDAAGKLDPLLEGRNAA